MNVDYKNHLLRQGFKLEQKIGSGLSGGTYRALQASLNRPVAVKFFDSGVSKNDHDLRKRFVREARLLSELQHPSIPYVITKGEVNVNKEDVPYIVMQYISGQGLDRYIKSQGKIDLDNVFHIATQILDALDFVHKKGIIHRDIKPSNIMILPSGHCYLIDFSIGYKQDGDAGMTRATRTGDHLGSVEYMSPEQARNMKDVDGRSDLFSFTKVLCELLSGKPEITGLDSLDNELSPAVMNVLKKGCSYDVDNRYSSAADYLRELKRSVTNISQFVEVPSKAVCISHYCPDANWSPQGYYKGPNFVEDSTNAYCTSCGARLVYKCIGCGHPIENTRFCGGCGTEQFSIPECESCGSFLKKEDMDKNTSELGCTKCRRKIEEARVQQQLEDDIPF